MVEIKTLNGIKMVSVAKTIKIALFLLIAEQSCDRTMEAAVRTGGIAQPDAVASQLDWLKIAF